MLTLLCEHAFLWLQDPVHGKQWCSSAGTIEFLFFMQ